MRPSFRFVSILLLAFLVISACTRASHAQSSATSPKKSKSKKSSGSKKKPKRPPSLRVRKIHRAFAASADLKPMAMQLIADRTPAAYAGVEKYARSHPGDPGALAWLAIGYAHHLDQHPEQEIDALKKARPHAEELGDYVDYHLGEAYLATGKPGAALEVLRDFDARHPDSILSRDALVSYANALVATGEAHRAVQVLEAHRVPTRAEVELALGRAYMADHENAKALTALRNLYYAMPLSTQADSAHGPMDSLERAGTLPPASFAERKKRADLLVQGKRYSDAVQEYRALQRDVPDAEAATLKSALAYALYKSGREREAKDLLQNLQGAPEEANAQRLYVLTEIARPDEKRVEQHLEEFRQQAPKSPWFAEALLSAANMFLLDRNFERAAAFYSEIDERFPGGRFSP